MFETLYSDRKFHIAAFLIKYGAKIQFYFHISLVYLSLFCMKDSKEEETCTKLWWFQILIVFLHQIRVTKIKEDYNIPKIMSNSKERLNDKAQRFFETIWRYKNTTCQINYCWLQEIHRKERIFRKDWYFGIIKLGIWYTPI